jgi:hypothetical protein
MQDLLVRQAASEDVAQLASMCHMLWPDVGVEEHARELLRAFTDTAPGNLPTVFLVAHQQQPEEPHCLISF